MISIIRVNEIVVGVTSIDPLSALSSDEVSNNIEHRLPRLAEHLLQQQSFFPVFPPPRNLGPQLGTQVVVYVRVINSFHY